MSSRPTKILFVCLGNICRSPTAEALFRARAAAAGQTGRFEVSSAGVIARGNDVAHSSTVRVAAEHGVDVSRHLSQPLSAELIHANDLIIAMDRLVAENVLDLVPDLGNRLKLLMRYAGDEAGDDVEDPIGQSIDVFRASYRQIEAGIDGMLTAMGVLPRRQV